MVFDFKDYKKYLNSVFSTGGPTRGKRSRLAEVLHCQTAFISHVLNGNSHFSLEHGVLISKFLNHTLEEARYFILLVSLGRAGSKTLEDFYRSQMDEISRKRTQIKEHITTDQILSAEIQMRYYSAWYYAGVHVATSVPEYQTRDALSVALGLNPALVSECLEFLVGCGLVVPKGNRFQIGPARIHLGADSAMISRLHTNWRVKALQSFEQQEQDQTNLHYSAVITLSHADVQRVRETLLKAIAENEKIFRPSKEEAVYCLDMDWFRVSK